ncbi:MAG: co-chaperone GroES [Spirochaetes bacterium GWF1_41_5]|nr:MAG: co-chaperone GroES [Spirochaetes bacterium GWF1_41_5]HBE03384.1 co-chaperone GroES [Spirochaetia bacterium]
MKIKPLGERVLLKKTEKETKTAGGLYIPETAQEKTQEAVVVAIGDSQDIKVKPNDKVIHDKYAGTEIKVEGVDHLIVKNEDIIAIVS